MSSPGVPLHTNVSANSFKEKPSCPHRNAGLAAQLPNSWKVRLAEDSSQCNWNSSWRKQNWRDCPTAFAFLTKLIQFGGQSSLREWTREKKADCLHSCVFTDLTSPHSSITSSSHSCRICYWYPSITSDCMSSLVAVILGVFPVTLKHYVFLFFVFHRCDTKHTIYRQENLDDYYSNNEV